MVHINIPLPETLHKRLRLAAAMDERTIKDLINEALERRASQQGTGA